MAPSCEGHYGQDHLLWCPQRNINIVISGSWSDSDWLALPFCLWHLWIDRVPVLSLVIVMRVQWWTKHLKWSHLLWRLGAWSNPTPAHRQWNMISSTLWGPANGKLNKTILNNVFIIFLKCIKVSVKADFTPCPNQLQLSCQPLPHILWLG